MAHEQDNWLGIDWLYSTYMWVWGGLLMMTVVEVIVPEPTLIGLSEFPRIVVVLALILLALAKTFCVAWYYMHLIDERPSIILVACAPFIFSVFLTVGLWPQSAPHSAIKEEYRRGGEKGPDRKKQSAVEPQKDRVEPVEKIDELEGRRLAERIWSRND